MNSKTVDNIKKAVLRELGEGAVSITGDIQSEYKTTLRDIAAYKQWKWLENVPLTLSTDDGQEYITVPDYIDPDGELAIYQSSGKGKIEWMEPHEYSELISGNTTATDNPARYTVIGGRFMFYPPMSDGTSAIFYVTINPDQVDVDEDNSIDGIEEKMPNHFETAVVWGILSKLDTDINNKAKWRGLMYNELDNKKIGRSKGRKIVGRRDPAITTLRSYMQN